ncbi:MAG: low specificity L-threonine aldolase, partial [Alphaproteobacteria bacterium]
MVNFCSDNATGASVEILRALEAANGGTAMPYGADDITARVAARLGEIFETEVAVFPVATGTAANVLALSVMVPPYGAVYCHREAHIHVDECGAPEFYTGGAKLIPLPGAHGKLDPQTLEGAITGAGVVHAVQPAAISLTQATEAGTVYTPDEVAAIAAVARRHGLGLHVDGARFANALVALGCSPAEATWKAGVDALSFGATKNGALGAEAVILFKPAPGMAEEFGYRRKRGGHLFSKMRFLSAQLEAYLADDLWLRNARHANAMARRLGDGLATLPGVALIHPVEANEVFARLPEAMIAGLLDDGFAFYRWGAPEACEVRLVTAFDTDPQDVNRFLTAAR